MPDGPPMVGQHFGMTVTDDKVAQCVEYYRRLLEAHATKGSTQARDSRLDVIIRRAGAQRRSKPLLARLDQAFTAAGIKTDPRLTDPGLKADERVFIFDADYTFEGPPPTRQLLFPNEQTLQSFIWANRDKLDEFRDLGLKGFKQQAVLDSGRRVDLLCHRSAPKQLVAIELKVGKPDDRAAGQLLQYLDDLNEHAARHGFDSARLLVIAGQPAKSVRKRVESYAASRGLTVTFLLYSLHMHLL